MLEQSNEAYYIVFDLMLLLFIFFSVVVVRLNSLSILTKASLDKAKDNTQQINK